MTTRDLTQLLTWWASSVSSTPHHSASLFGEVARRLEVIQTRVEPLRTFPPAFDTHDLDVVLSQLHSARRMRRQIIEGNDLDVLVPTLHAFLFDDEPLAHKFATYPALIRYAGLPILGEFFGWVHADKYPLYTRRALDALRRLGWSVPARSYPSFNAAFSALRHAYESMNLRLAPQLPLNLEVDQFLIWTAGAAARAGESIPGVPVGPRARAAVWTGSTEESRALPYPGAIREYGAAYESENDPDEPVRPDAPLPIPSAERFAEAERSIRRELALPGGILQRAAAHLLAGRHLILTGAPGTGKSHFAQLLARELFEYEPMLVTATAEWSAFDVVGGLVPAAVPGGSLHYTIRPGYVYEALRRNLALDGSGAPRRDAEGRPLRRGGHGDGGPRGVWLIIDELNRADVDKAFGELFSALEEGVLRVPRAGLLGSALIPLPQDFRIIATLNTRDRHFLFTLSSALKRRFAFLELTPPTDPAEECATLLRRALRGLAENGVSTSAEKLESALDSLLLFARIVRAFHPLGSAPLLAALRYIGAARAIGVTGDGEALIDQAVAAEILPQLEGVRDFPLALLADLVSGNKATLLARLEHELRQGGRADTSARQAITSLTGLLRRLATDADDPEGWAVVEALFDSFHARGEPAIVTDDSLHALQALRPVVERLLPEWRWPLTAAQLEAWVAERQL